jgi:5'-phosphate synthase pdxT subunit
VPAAIAASADENTPIAIAEDRGALVASGSAPSASAPRLVRIGVLALQGAFVEHAASLQRLQPALLQSDNVQLDVSFVRTGAELRGERVGLPGQAVQPLDGLIIPGGESTTMRRLLNSNNDGLLSSLRSFIHDEKRPVFGTCAGCILLADRVASDDEKQPSASGSPMAAVAHECKTDSPCPPSPASAMSESAASSSSAAAAVPLLGGLDMTVARNHYGRQLASFNTDDVQLLDQQLVSAFEAEDGREKKKADANVDIDSSSARCKGVFIRAPAIVQLGPGVQALAALPHAEAHRHTNIPTPSVTMESACVAGSDLRGAAAAAGAAVVAVRSGALLATCFHPELTDDLRWHAYFVRQCVLGCKLSPKV